jgi:hypothetical protein
MTTVSIVLCNLVSALRVPQVKAKALDVSETPLAQAPRCRYNVSMASLRIVWDPRKSGVESGETRGDLRGGCVRFLG